MKILKTLRLLGLVVFIASILVFIGTLFIGGYTLTEKTIEQFFSSKTDFVTTALKEVAREKEILNKAKNNFFTHIGIYAYTNNFLQIFTKLKETFLEKLECLEQLRAIENGYKLYLVETKYKSLAVDTAKDLQKVIAQIKYDKKI